MVEPASGFSNTGVWTIGSISARSRLTERPFSDPRQPLPPSTAQRWLQTAILASFATIALLLASIGVYGLIAYTVGQRQREYGIRLALGATRREIVTQVTRRGATLFAVGAICGLIAAAATARLLSTMLFRVSSFDFVSFTGAALVLLIVALAATGVPARRAASVDPAVTLRTD